MGDAADAVLEGEDCQVCGEFMGDGDGYPRTCGGCDQEGVSDLDPLPTEAPRQEDEKLNRVIWARKRLKSEKCDIEPGPDKWSLKVFFHSGRTFYFWPFSGWFSQLKGDASGRGIANLLRASKGEALKGIGNQ